MSWTYFTSYLTGSRPIRKVERDELYTQLAAKFTGCAAMFSLNSTQQAAITGSLLLTDRAGLDNSDDSSNTLGTLNDIIEATSSVWYDFAGAKASALSSEGISSSDLTAILGARVESYHLWNYYKRIIDLLVCCTPPESLTITCRSRSASKTKCGFDEFGTPSSPPKKYLVKTFAGTMTSVLCGWVGDCSDGGACTCDHPCRHDFTQGGSITYNRPSCSVTDTSTADCVSDECPEFSHCNYLPGCTVSETTTVKTTSASGSCFSYDFDVCALNTGTLTETLSSEYTTTQLLSDVDTALSAAGWTSYGTCGAGNDATYDLSSDELTATKRACQVKVDFAASSGLRISWDIWDRTSDTLVGHYCSTLFAFDTEFIINIDPPSTPGASYYATNIVIDCGTC